MIALEVKFHKMSLNTENQDQCSKSKYPQQLISNYLPLHSLYLTGQI